MQRRGREHRRLVRGRDLLGQKEREREEERGEKEKGKKETEKSVFFFPSLEKDERKTV